MLGAALFVPATALAAAGSEAEIPAGLDEREAVPDVVVVLPDGSSEEVVAAAGSDLSAVPGVAWAATDSSVGTRPVVSVGFAAGAGDDPLGAVEAVVAGRDDAGSVDVGGRAVSDRDMQDRIGRAVFIGLLLAGIAVGALAAILAGWFRGLLGGLTAFLGAWLGGLLGATAAGPFDGSVATTAIPAAMASVVVAGYVVLRLLAWFENPAGEDQAEMIRRSVNDVGQDLLLGLAGLLVAVLFLEPVGPGRSVATIVFVGAATSALLTLAVLPASLAALHGASGLLDRLANRRHGLTMTPPFFPFIGPNGRHFPIAVLAGFSAFIALLALLSFQSTGRGSLLDQSSTSAGEDAVALLGPSGDPTAGIVASFPSGTDQMAKTAWLQRVSLLPGVARVDSSEGRHLAGELVTEDPAQIGLPAAAVSDDEAPSYALVVPAASGRSPAAQQLVESIRDANGPVAAELSGEPVDARSGAARDRSVIWLSMFVLSVAGGLSVYALLGDRTLALVVAGMRLVESMAMAGTYHLLVGSPTGAEILVLIFVAALGAGLFELGYLRRLLHGHRIMNAEVLLDRAMATNGMVAIISLGLAVVTSLGLLAAGLPVVSRLGVVMAVALILEVVVGLWLLRPALLGDRAVAHFASQPVRDALRVVQGASDAPENAGWQTIVTDLLHAEFAFQTDPEAAVIDSVFLADTPAHRDTQDRHQKLIDSGLRITGRAPILRSLKLVGSAGPVALAAIVDNPVRQLVDDEGAIVGIRRPERRSLMLWLIVEPEGGYRISDAIEVGNEPISQEVERPLEAPTAVRVSME